MRLTWFDCWYSIWSLKERFLRAKTRITTEHLWVWLPISPRQKNSIKRAFAGFQSELSLYTWKHGYCILKTENIYVHGNVSIIWLAIFFKLLCPKGISISGTEKNLFKIVSSTNGFRKLDGHMCIKIKLELYLTSFTEVNSQME